MYIKSPIFICVFLWSSITLSQSDVSNVIVDLLTLSQNYIEPATDGLVYQSTSSWYSSAKSLDKFEVDVSVHFNALPIQKKHRTNEISNSDFVTMQIRGGNTSTTVPSAFGGDTDVFLDYFIEGEEYELQAFEGIDQNVVMHPYLQASIGLWKETDLTLRYSPKVKIDVTKYRIFGGAIKHNISQYFRKNDSIRKGIEVAGLVSYSKFDVDLFFDEIYLEPRNPDPGSVPLAVINSVIVDADAWLFQLIASKQFKNIELVGSLGYTASNFEYNLGGEDGFVLDLFNQALDVLDGRKTGFKGDVGLNYHFGRIYVSSMMSVGKFLNTNVALHYRI